MNCPSCGTANVENVASCPQCAWNQGVRQGPANPPGFGNPQGYPPQGYGFQPPVMPRTSGMAVAGFVLSFFCSLLGLIFSCIGLSECKKSNGMVTGEGLAVAGIVISILGFLITMAVLAAGNH